MADKKSKLEELHEVLEELIDQRVESGNFSLVRENIKWFIQLYRLTPPFLVRELGAFRPLRRDWTRLSDRRIT